jgi:outer membrane protein assembly factor BamB
MTIKILCECGTKFAFDVEPIGGKIPAPVTCPSCAKDATEAANEIIAQQLGMSATAAPLASAPAPVVSSGGSMKVAPPAHGVSTMRVAGSAPSAPPVGAPPVSDLPEAPAPAVEMCAKHPDSPAAANCVVCHKPICLDCMALFGYLCSAYCKGLASRKNIYVPPYAGMKTELVQAENRKGNRLLMAAGSAAVLFLAAFIWYNFFGSKPKIAWKIEAPKTARFVYSQWVGRKNIAAVMTDKAALYDGASGKMIWESAFKADEKPEQKMFRKTDDEDADTTFFTSINIRAKVVGNDLWVIFPRKAVRIDLATGKRKSEIALPEAIDDGTFSDTTFLGVAKPTEGKKVLARIDLNSGQMNTLALTQAVARINYPALNRMPTVGSGSGFMNNVDRESDSFGAARLQEDRPEYYLSGNSVVNVQVKLLEQRMIAVQAMREKKGPSIIDSGNARASQGLEAAEEMFNENRRAETGGVRLEDESRYLVTLRRPLGGGSAWSGEVVGPPAFFPLRNIDLLVAGKGIYAFSKNGQRLWESKITYPVAPRFVEGLTEERPALEHGSKLFFFDQGNLIAFDAKNGQVAWRLQSVGISSLKIDPAGKLYVATTTAGPDQIKYSEEISINEKIHPVLMKVDPSSGAIIWQKDRLGQEIFISGKYVYATQSRISGMDHFSAMTSGGGDAPVHSRLYRVDPDNGKDLWEFYRPKPPQSVDPRENRLLLQYGNEILMVKYFSL